MKVNIAQAIKRIKKSPDFFRPLYESIINSIQADADIIKINFQLEEHDGEEPIYNIVSYSIEDNGHGFTDEDADAFLTLYTERNADKGALGSGRILCLKVFDDIFITSQTKNNGQELGKETKINFNVNFNYNSIDELVRAKKSSDKSYTITEYKNLKQAYQNKEFNLDQIKENIFTELLPLFIEYSTNDKNLTIFIDDQEWINKTLISNKMQSYNFKEKVFSISSNDNSITKDFKLYYRIENDDTRKNMQFYAAAYRKIKDFPNDTKVSDDLPGRPSIIFCLTSDYFKEIVDDSREDFIVFFNQNNPTEEAPITMPSINLKLRETIRAIIVDKFPNIMDNFNLKKEEVINQNPYLARYVKDMDDFTKSIDDIKKDAEKLFENSSKKVKEEVKKFSENILKTRKFQKDKYIEITKDFTETGQEQLAHYFAYRQVIIEMLKNIYQTNTSKDSEKLFSEGDIHDLIMPRKTSNHNNIENVVQNNFWLFNDKFMTFNFAASDNTMEKIREELAMDLGEVPRGYELDRPDLLILYSANETSTDSKDVVIIELKKIGLNEYDKSKALDQLATYADIFRKIMVNQIKDVFVYSFFEFDTKFEDLLRRRGYQPNILSGGEHRLHYYYSYIPSVQAYINVLSFDSVVFTADKRNRLFLDILTGNIRNS